MFSNATRAAGSSSASKRKLDVFPIFQKVAARSVVIIGFDGEAAAKVRLLSETNANLLVITPPSIAAGPDAALQQAIDSAGAQLLQVEPQAEHIQEAALLFTATGDEKRDGQLIEFARAHGVPANAVDRPHLCDFYVGALVNRAPVAVAITSTGVGPVYARHIRAKIESLLPLQAGDLAQLAESFRDTVARLLPSGIARRRFWAQFFSGPVAYNVLAGQPEKARSAAQRLLNGAQQQEGFVWLVGAGPGAEDLLTLRAQRVLQEADVILYDALVPEAVVAMGRRDAQRIYVGKRKGAHAYSQEQISAKLVEHAAAGRRVVRLKAGDPLVFGRAGEEMAALQEAGISYDIVPGITAAAASAASTKLPLSLRGVASSIVYATGHDQHGQILPNWGHLALSGSTVAVYMGKSVAAKVANTLQEAGLCALTPVLAVENASQQAEQVYSGCLSQLQDLAKNEEVTGPTLIIIGAAVAHAQIEAAKPFGAATQKSSQYQSAAA
ncbi:siroheme synthase CysG [Polycladidibacter hongkongensis]|uniref:siroheme synthase CysG n=1 Tax=Polycladidibacter hongkongensis TaxID=1647556 RepID=UPI000833AAF5|nr:siroheme synthase CysG [Pseudovibrio hongkongensis]